MSAATETRNGQGAATSAGSQAPARNVHERKLAVMVKCAEIAPDKTHPHHKFDYISIQNLSGHLRKFCAEEGLDVICSVTDGAVVIQLVNVASPEDQITTTWPVVEDDKGYAYSIKFPLMRLFLIGDGEENDEATMATKSGQAATQAARQPQRAAPAGTRSPLGPCPECAEEGITAASGKPAVYWPPREPGPGRFPQCNGIRDSVYMNHQMRPLTGVGAAVSAAVDDGSDLPF